MKKVLLALPLVAGASWAGSTYYAGTQAQPAYEKLLADLNQAATGVFILEAADYSAGFTESVATTNVKFMHTDEPVLFQLQHDINHSPVGTDPEGARFSASSITTTLLTESLGSEDIQQFFTSFDSGEPFTLYTDVGFSGNVTSDLQLSALSMDFEDGSINFEGGRFDAVSDSGKIDVSGILGKLSVDNGSGALVNVAESNAQFDFLRVASSVYTGEQQITFPEVSFTDAAMGSTVTFTNSVISSTTSLNGDKLDSETNLSVAMIESPLPLNSLSWDANVNGLSVDGLENYTTTMNRIMTMSQEGQEVGNLEVELMNAYKGLLTPGARFSNKMTVTNDGGDVIGDMGVKFNGDGSANGLDNMVTVADVLQAIVINLDLEADTAAIDLTPAAMFMMHPMAQQYIRNDGDRYTSNISVADLMLTVNGDQTPLESYLGDKLYEPMDFSAMADY